MHVMQEDRGIFSPFPCKRTRLGPVGSCPRPALKAREPKDDVAPSPKWRVLGVEDHCLIAHDLAGPRNAGIDIVGPVPLMARALQEPDRGHPGAVRDGRQAGQPSRAVATSPCASSRWTAGRRSRLQAGLSVREGGRQGSGRSMAFSSGSALADHSREQRPRPAVRGVP